MNAQLQSLATQVVSYHFCQFENAPTCSVPEFVHSMASQLSQSPIMKPYYQLLVSNHKIRSRLTIEECLVNPDDSFVMGIIEPLRSLHGQESIGSVNCVILIDSLCDSELHRPDQVRAHHMFLRILNLLLGFFLGEKDGFSIDTIIVIFGNFQSILIPKLKSI